MHPYRRPACTVRTSAPFPAITYRSGPCVPEAAFPPYFPGASRDDRIREQAAVPVRVPLLCQFRICAFQIVQAFQYLSAGAVRTGSAVSGPLVHGRTEQMALPAPPHGPHVGTEGHGIRRLSFLFSGDPLGRRVRVLLPERDKVTFHIFLPFVSFLFQLYISGKVPARSFRSMSSVYSGAVPAGGAGMGPVWSMEKRRFLHSRNCMVP